MYAAFPAFHRGLRSRKFKSKDFPTLPLSNPPAAYSGKLESSKTPIGILQIKDGEARISIILNIISHARRFYFTNRGRTPKTQSGAAPKIDFEEVAVRKGRHFPELMYIYRATRLPRKSRKKKESGEKFRGANAFSREPADAARRDRENISVGFESTLMQNRGNLTPSLRGLYPSSSADGGATDGDPSFPPPGSPP